MSIAEKNTIISANNVTIAENEQRVYKAGQLNVLANAESLNGSLSGEAVSANDVSSVEHIVGCNVSSKNLFEFKQGTIDSGTIIEKLENGAIVQGNYAENDNPNSWANGWYSLKKSMVTLKAGDVVTLSCDYTVLELNENRTMEDFQDIGIKKVGLYLQSSGSNHYLRPTNQPKILGETVRMSVTATITVDGEYYPTVTINSNKVRIENIQIEAGSKATAYTPYVSDFSSVNVSRYGKNLLEFKQGYLKPGTVVEYLDNGIIAQGVLGGRPGRNDYDNGWYSFKERTSVFLKGGDTVVVSADYTILELAEGYTDIKNVGVYLYGANSMAEVSSVLPSLNKTVRIYAKYNITVDGNYYPIITLNSNKVRIENVQIEVGSKSTGYEEYKGKQTITANADGTVEGITSIAPNMTLLTDTEGVVINANYYKDPDIVISNLAQSVALSGGEG